MHLEMYPALIAQYVAVIADTTITATITSTASINIVPEIKWFLK